MVREVSRVLGESVTVSDVVVQIHVTGALQLPDGSMRSVSTARAVADLGPVRAIMAAANEAVASWSAALEESVKLYQVSQGGARLPLYREYDTPWDGVDGWSGAVRDWRGDLWIHMPAWRDERGERFLSPTGQGTRHWSELSFPVTAPGPEWTGEL